MIISGQICGSKLQRVFTLGDGRWPPRKDWRKKRPARTLSGAMLGVKYHCAAKRGRQKGDRQKGNQKREKGYQKVTKMNVSGLPPSAHPLLRYVETRGSQTDHFSGTKKEHKPKLLGPDIFRWGGVGAKTCSMTLEAQGNQTCWRDIPGFWLGYSGGARKVREKKVSLQFLAP